MLLTRQQLANLNSVLTMYADGGCYFQDFINECVNSNCEILKVILSFDNKYITCTLALQGQSAPLYPITAILRQ